MEKMVTRLLKSTARIGGASSGVCRVTLTAPKECWQLYLWEKRLVPYFTVFLGVLGTLLHRVSTLSRQSAGTRAERE